jgi:hypothetical protein
VPGQRNRGIPTSYELGSQIVGVLVPAEERETHLHNQTGSGAHPASYRMSTGSLSPGIKRSGLEADHSPPTSAEVKITWIYTSSSQYASMLCCLVKYRDNFTFTLRILHCIGFVAASLYGVWRMILERSGRNL